MKHSIKDIYLALISLLFPVHIISWAIYYSHLSLIVNSAIFFISFCWFWYNGMIATHNFIHTPFFKNNNMNRAYTLINSCSIGVPHMMFHYHHMQHHSHNNSLKDPSSTLRYGKNGKQENWLSYCAFAPYRRGTFDMFQMSLDKGKGIILFSQIACISIFYLFLFSISVDFLFYIYFPIFYIGWFFSSMENYFEHYRASNPDNRFSNSVSYYGSLYNKIFLNVGYHQEHHLEPQTHWSDIRTVKEKYAKKMSDNDLFISTGPPLLGHFSKQKY